MWGFTTDTLRLHRHPMHQEPGQIILVLVCSDPTSVDIDPNFRLSMSKECLTVSNLCIQ